MTGPCPTCGGSGRLRVDFSGRVFDTVQPFPVRCRCWDCDPTASPRAKVMEEAIYTFRFCGATDLRLHAIRPDLDARPPRTTTKP